MKLTEFLLARLAEDEMAAHHLSQFKTRRGRRSVRALAECGAKRLIVELHDSERPGRCRSCGGFVSQSTPRGIEHSGYAIPYPCPTLRAVALPYADHEDFDERWRP